MTRPFGTVRTTSSGRHQALYQHRLTGGRQVVRTFDTRAQAERWLDDERRKLLGGDWHDPRGGRVIVGEFFVSWLQSRRLAPRTRELYSWLWTRHIGPSLGSLRMADMTPAVVRAWHAGILQAGRPGAVTIAKCYRLLSTVLSDAMRDGLLTRHPCTIRGAGIERSPEMRTVTPEQVRLLADTIDPQFRALVLVAAYGGLRWGECAGLPVAAVDVQAGAVRVGRVLVETTAGGISFGPPKTAAGRRTVHLPRSVMAALDAHIEERTACSEPTGLVFTTRTGQPMRRTGFVKPWRTATRAAGVEGLRFHDLRHTAATLATVHGATLREVQARLGHATPHAALRYQHAVEGRDLAIASALEEVFH